MKLLLIDDEKSIINALKRELRGWARESGVEVIGFNSGLMLLTYLEDVEDVFLIISDLKMPEMLGSDLLLEVSEKYPEIQTILLTGYSEINEISKSIKAGISAYMMKPWDENLLIQEVQNNFEIYNLTQDKKNAEERLNEELKWGGELQRKILNKDLPDKNVLKYDIVYKPLPSLYCGGDYYDIITLNSHTYLIIVGDVAGHGLKAAFITTMMKSIIYSQFVRRHTLDVISPGSFLTWLNKRLGQELEQFPDLLVAITAIMINTESQELSYSMAAQPPLVLLRKGAVHLIHQKGLFINAAADTVYTNKKLEYLSGDKIILYTDGLIETQQDRASIDNETLKQMIQEWESQNGNLNDLMMNFRNVSVDENFTDDVTLLELGL